MQDSFTKRRQCATSKTDSNYCNESIRLVENLHFQCFFSFKMIEFFKMSVVLRVETGTGYHGKMEYAVERHKYIENNFENLLVETAFQWVVC